MMLSRIVSLAATTAQQVEQLAVGVGVADEGLADQIFGPARLVGFDVVIRLKSNAQLLQELA